MSKSCPSPPMPLQSILWFFPIFEIFYQNIFIDFPHFWNILSKYSNIGPGGLHEQILPLSSTAATSLTKYVRSAQLFCKKQENSSFGRKLCDVLWILKWDFYPIILKPLFCCYKSTSNDGSVAKSWGSKVFLDLKPQLIIVNTWETNNREFSSSLYFTSANYFLSHYNTKPERPKHISIKTWCS